MKSLHIASILAVSAAIVFACNDDQDRYGLGNSAGTTSGEAGGPNASGSAGQAHGGEAGSSGGGGAAGADAGGNSGAMAGGAAGEAGMASSAGEGGDAGSGGEAGTGGAGPDPDPLELIGEYDDNFGGSFEITADAWSTSAIAAYDNAQNVVYTQFPANDMYNPNKFAKTVYTEPTGGGSFYFCMVVYSADTLAAAQASTATADDSNPETGGCGGQFPWTKATPK
jgi:hypothetical protein